MKHDIEIARETKLEDIEVIREKLGIASHGMRNIN